jgi:hypothetical protein
MRRFCVVIIAVLIVIVSSSSLIDGFTRICHDKASFSFIPYAPPTQWHLLSTLSVLCVLVSLTFQEPWAFKCYSILLMEEMVIRLSGAMGI